MIDVKLFEGKERATFKIMVSVRNLICKCTSLVQVQLELICVLCLSVQHCHLPLLSACFVYDNSLQYVPSNDVAGKKKKRNSSHTC